MNTREELIEAMATEIALAEDHPLSEAEAAFAAIEALGCRVVPKIPAEDMMHAAMLFHIADDIDIMDVWIDMLAASPFAPPQETQP